MSRKRVPGATRTSLYLTPALKRALAAVAKAEHVTNTHQLQIGLRLYLERHRALLDSLGIDPWQR